MVNPHCLFSQKQSVMVFPLSNPIFSCYYNIYQMIFFYNQTGLGVNQQLAYQELRLKFETLVKDYAGLIQLRQNIKQKIKTLSKQNEVLKTKKLQKGIQNVQKESSSYVPPMSTNSKQSAMRPSNRSQQKMKIKISESSSLKYERQGYECTYEGCHKVYSNAVTMNLHIRTKHNGGNKKQRQYYARILLQAEQKGLQPPKPELILPPNFLEEYRTSLEYMKKYCK